jgi:uncharacterized protein YjbI with pentapeptide repeats
MPGAKLLGTDLRNANLTAANLERAEIKTLGLTEDEIRFSYGFLPNMTWKDALLDGANLSGATMPDETKNE